MDLVERTAVPQSVADYIEMAEAIVLHDKSMQTEQFCKLTLDGKQQDLGAKASGLLVLLTCPPILPILCECINVADLRNLRLVCTLANECLNGSERYYTYLSSLTIPCKEATYTCSSEVSCCIHCRGVVCRSCIPGVPKSGYPKRSRPICDTCRPKLITGRCRCGEVQRWICRSCHRKEVEQDRFVEWSSRNRLECYKCYRALKGQASGSCYGSSTIFSMKGPSSVLTPLALNLNFHAQFNSFDSFTSPVSMVCSWCNKWISTGYS
ncbi:hypothetical protein V1511DRAFT_507168, partial [Dipodascopsis uninucleata]